MEVLVNPVSLAKEPRFINLTPKKTQFKQQNLIPTTSATYLPLKTTTNGLISSIKFTNCEKFQKIFTEKLLINERPFKIFVKNQTFTVDSTKLSQKSPIFALMCFGQEFENGSRELCREIVDEKSEDISDFLNCLQSPKKISRKILFFVNSFNLF